MFGRNKIIGQRVYSYIDNCLSQSGVIDYIVKTLKRNLTEKKLSKIPFLIKNSLAKLDILGTAKTGALLSSLHHFDENTGRTRQKRADRRGNILRILEIVIPQIDLDTFAWGKWFKNHKGETDFYTRGLDYLVKETGMSERTVIRVMEDLDKCGYIKSSRREAIGKDGGQIRHYSLRNFTTKFFMEMGFKKRTIETTRAWKRKKNEKSYYSQKISSTCKQGLEKIGNLFKKHSNKKSFKKPTINKYTNVSKNAVSVRETKNLLWQAKDIADRLGTSPMDEYRKLLG